MAATIPLIDIPTTVARPTGVTRVHKHQGNACPLSFIDEEIRQLPETPVVVPAALPCSNRDPVTNVRQVFQHKRGFRVFGIRNKTLRKRMVDPALKLRLLPCEFFQAPFGTFGASGLIGLAMGGTARADHLNRLSGIRVAIGVSRNVCYAQIDAQKMRGRNRCVFWDVNRGIQVERPLSIALGPPAL